MILLRFSLKVDTVFQPVVLVTLAIPFGGRAGTKHKHYYSRCYDTNKEFFHTSLKKVGYSRLSPGNTGQELIKEIPEELAGRVYINKPKTKVLRENCIS